MLPFLKKTKESSVSVPSEAIERKPDDEKEPEYDGLHAAMEELSQAMHSKDIPAMASAFRSAMQICDSEPHEEGSHEQ